jgi:hypothetical protein
MKGQKLHPICLAKPKLRLAYRPWPNSPSPVSTRRYVKLRSSSFRQATHHHSQARSSSAGLSPALTAPLRHAPSDIAPAPQRTPQHFTGRIRYKFRVYSLAAPPPPAKPGSRPASSRSLNRRRLRPWKPYSLGTDLSSSSLSTIHSLRGSFLSRMITAV